MATQIILTSGTSWTVPSDWNNYDNKIEVIGGGGSGAGEYNASSPGGGGGAYSRIDNTPLSPGASITYAIGAGGPGVAGNGNGTDGGDTCFGAATISGTGILVGAKGGKQGNTVGNTAGLGGDAALGVGTIKYSGGNGEKANAVTTGGGGAGGAAGPNGDGNDGYNHVGGSGDAGFGGAGGLGAAGSRDGSPGFEWGTVGSGGGAGGASTNSTAVNGNGGLYGGGGGGSYCGTTCGNKKGGNGAQGLIVITYTPSNSSFWSIF